MSEEVDFESQVKEHFEVLSVIAGDFAKGYSNTRPIDIHINESLLLLAASSGMQDITRYKEYHLDDPSSMKSDAVKRTAYMVYWLLKFRPLTVSKNGGGSPKPDDDSFLANEIFCLFLAVAYLSSETKVDFRFHEDKARELLYNFLYRDLTTDALILFFQTIKDMLEKKPIIEGN